MTLANKEFEKLGEYVIEKGAEAGYWDDNLVELMRDNVKSYATIDVTTGL